MGICQDKAYVNIRKANRSSSVEHKESFLYNSFANDPGFSTDIGFFFFDVPHYSEIQYLLRKNYNQPSDGIEMNIENHIEEIQQSIKKLKESTIKYKQRHEQEEIAQQEDEQISHVLNFQLISIKFTDNESHGSSLAFSIQLNDAQILRVDGRIEKNRWKPISENKISKQGIKIDIQAVKHETKIKIYCLQGKEELQCTISCNKTTFRYVIPVLQTSNLRRKQDNQPVGQIVFRVQYVEDYQEHKLKVINDLEGRKKGLLTILQKLRIDNTNNILQVDKTIELDQEQESFMTDKIE